MEAGGGHHTRHVHTCWFFTDQGPSGCTLLGFCSQPGQTLRPLREPGTQGSSHGDVTQAFSEETDSTGHHPKLSTGLTGTPWHLAAQRVPGAQHWARQSPQWRLAGESDPPTMTRSDLPVQECCSNDPKPKAHRHTCSTTTPLRGIRSLGFYFPPARPASAPMEPWFSQVARKKGKLTLQESFGSRHPTQGRNWLVRSRLAPTCPTPL